MKNFNVCALITRMCRCGHLLDIIREKCKGGIYSSGGIYSYSMVHVWAPSCGIYSSQSCAYIISMHKLSTCHAKKHKASLFKVGRSLYVLHVCSHLSSIGISPCSDKMSDQNMFWSDISCKIPAGYPSTEPPIFYNAGAHGLTVGGHSPRLALVCMIEVA